MVFLRILCNVADESFERFTHLNQQKNETDYNKVLYEVVKFGERHNYEKELNLIMQQLAYEPDNRMAPEKLFTEIQSLF